MLRFISMNVPVAWDLFELFSIAAVQSAFLELPDSFLTDIQRMQQDYLLWVL